MKIELREISVREICDGYKDSEEEGVFAFGGRLNVRPRYQREFVYDDKKRNDGHHLFDRQRPVCQVPVRQVEQRLQHIGQIAPVPVSHRFQLLPCLRDKGQSPPRQLFGARDDRFQSVFRQAFQHKDFTTGQQGGIQLERRIFRRRADQNDRAVFHIRQKSVLLGTVEPVDFVNK